MARPGRRERHGSPQPSEWIPVPLPVAPALFASIVVYAFVELEVGAALWVKDDFWHPLHKVPGVTAFEYEYGVESRRFLNNQRCLTRAKTEERTVIGEHLGFRDLFVPVRDEHGVCAVLVVGPLAVGRSDTPSILQRWQSIGGGRGRLSEANFARYVATTLTTLTLEGEDFQKFRRLLECCADLLGRGGDPARLAAEAQALREELRAVRLPELMWQTTREIVERASVSNATPVDHGTLAHLGIETIPDQVLVGMLLPRKPDSDPVDDFVRRDGFLRACVGLARKRGGIVCGPLGSQGVVFLSARSGAPVRTKAKLAALALEASVLARRFQLKLHAGMSVGREALSVRYQSATWAAERALSEGKGLVEGETRSIPSADRLRELRSEFGRSTAGRPTLLLARFDRYVEQVLAHTGYRHELVRLHLESGFERLMESLLAGGFLDRKSHAELFVAMAKSVEGATSVMALVDGFRALVAELEKTVTDSGTARQDRGTARAVSFMREHLSEPLTLPMVAKAAGFAPRYFSRLFARAEGVPFSDYLRDLRLAQAKQMLRRTVLSVEQVQKLTGFKTRTNFHRTFKVATGLTPIQFRERWG